MGLEQAHGRSLTDAEKDRLYQGHLLEVEIVQVQQAALLRCLVKHHGLKEVFLEGLTREGLEEYRDVRRMLLDLQLVKKEGEVKDVMVQRGAAARVRGVEVLPLDDARLHEEAKPVQDGKVQPDPVKIRRRREAMVKTVLANGDFGLIFLGASHNMTGLLPPGCEYIRVRVRHLPE